MNTGARQFLLSREGATAVEFAILLPILLAVVAFLIEFVNIGFRYHQGNEAVRRGARTAIVAAPIIDANDLEIGSIVTCRKASGAVACTGASVSEGASFDKIVAAMKVIMPQLAESEVEVEYRHSGIGSADLPNGVFPLVTVRLKDHRYDLTVGRLVPGIPASLTLPAMSVTMTGSGKKVGS